MKHCLRLTSRSPKWVFILALPILCSVGAAAAVFTIDSARSSINLSSKVLGFACQEQRAGSLSTKFEGTIHANATDVSIVFSGSSLVSAQNSGSWEPKANGDSGSDAANYGGKASAGLLGSALAAVRNIQLDVTSPPLTLTGGRFDSGSLLYQFLLNSKGALDYSVAGFVPMKGSIPLAGLATNRVTTQATLTTSGNIQTLTIPVTADFFFKLVSANDTTLTLTGQIVATRTVETGGSPFGSWVASSFPGVADPNVVGPGADPDQDGIPNLVEFAFGLNPANRDPAFAPLKASLSSAIPVQRVMEFIRPKGLTGVNYQLVGSDDLKAWTPLSTNPEIIDLGGGREKVVVRDMPPVAADRRRFVLLNVSGN